MENSELNDAKTSEEQAVEIISTKEVSPLNIEIKPLSNVGVDDIKMKLDTSKSLEEQAMDVAGAAATFEALKSEDTQKELTGIKSEELVTKAEARSKKAKAEVKTEEKNLQAANYGIYEGIAEYASIKKPLPDTMQKIIFAILGVLQGFIIVIFGLVFSLVNIVMDMINGLAQRFAELTANAKKIAIALFVAFAVVVVLLIILYSIETYAGIKIYNR